MWVCSFWLSSSLAVPKGKKSTSEFIKTLNNNATNDIQSWQNQEDKVKRKLFFVEKKSTELFLVNPIYSVYILVDYRERVLHLDFLLLLHRPAFMEYASVPLKDTTSFSSWSRNFNQKLTFRFLTIVYFEKIGSIFLRQYYMCVGKSLNLLILSCFDRDFSQF